MGNRTGRTLILLVALVLIEPSSTSGTSAVPHGGHDFTAASSLLTGSAAPTTDKDVYAEDFEDGWADNWGFGQTDVRVTKGRANNLLRAGPSSSASYLFGQSWRDYVFQTRVKLVGGDLQLGFRQRIGDPNGDGGYFLSFFKEGLILSRARSGSFEMLAQKQLRHRSRVWYLVKISIRGNLINVFVDGIRRIRLTDREPVPFGSISLSTPGPSSRADFDDVKVTAKLPFPVTWSLTNGPRGLGQVTTIVTDPSDGNAVYAGTYHSGMQRSNDGGETWTPVLDKDGLTQTKVRDIAVAPSRPNTIYVTHQDRRGGSISKDGGVHWTQMGLVGDWFEVSAVAVHPSDADRLFAGARTSPSGPSAPADGIYESRDGGMTWTKLSAGSIGIHDLAIAPTDPNVIYAGTVSGLLKSTDGGSSWTDADSGLVGLGSEPLPITQVVVDPRNEDVVYSRGGDEGPMFKTTDGGGSWRKIREHVTALALSPSQPDIVYSAGAAGIIHSVGETRTIWRSIDGGESWTQGAGSVDVGRVITAIAVDPADPQNLQIGGLERIVVSDDGGTTVRSPTGDFRGAYSTAIAISPHDANVVYVGHGDGIISKTANGGTTWQRLVTLGTGSDTSQISAIATSALDANLVLASNLEGIYRSTNAGQSFTKINEGLEDSRIISVAIDPSDDSKMFAGTGSHRPYLVYEGTGMYRSVNGGDSWTKIPGLPEAPVPAIVVHPQNHDIVWASFMGYGIYRSTNGGETWIRQDTGLEVPYVYTMAVDPTGTDVAYAGTLAYYGTPEAVTEYQGQGTGGLYKTEDGGQTWKLVLLHDMLENVVVSPTDPSNVWATAHSELVWHSSNGGKTWRFASDGLARYGAHLYLFGMAISADGSTMYLANCGRGVYRNRLTVAEGS